MLGRRHRQAAVYRIFRGWSHKSVQATNNIEDLATGGISKTGLRLRWFNANGLLMLSKLRRTCRQLSGLNPSQNAPSQSLRKKCAATLEPPPTKLATIPDYRRERAPYSNTRHPPAGSYRKTPRSGSRPERAQGKLAELNCRSTSCRNIRAPKALL